MRTHALCLARPCDAAGEFLPPNTPPLPRDEGHDWTPFTDRPSFEFAELEFEKVHASAEDINHLLRIWAAKNMLDCGGPPPFESTDDLMVTIDAIPYGECRWHTFRVRYAGPIAVNAPSWQTEMYTTSGKTYLVLGHSRTVLECPRALRVLRVLRVSQVALRQTPSRSNL